jgi:hypothetical protein
VNRTIRCTACEASLHEPIGPCPFCGGPIEVSVGLTGVGAMAQSGTVGAVARESVAGGGERIRYSASTGARSESVLVDARVRTFVQARVDAGKRGEEDVFARVLDVLRATGTVPIICPGASDSAGEDRVVRYRDERIVVQIVTASPGPSFWRDVAAGGADVEVDVETAAAWVHQAISEKARRYSPEPKRTMLLAVDMRHLGVLLVPEFVLAYVRTHGARHGFGGVWLIGPTDDRCQRVGDSQW